MSKYDIFYFSNDYYDYERPKSCKRNDVGIRHSSNICKYCVDLRLEKTELIHENHRLKNGYSDFNVLQLQKPPCVYYNGYLVS